jgi:hypothetical protein
MHELSRQIGMVLFDSGWVGVFVGVLLLVGFIAFLRSVTDRRSPGDRIWGSEQDVGTRNERSV